MAEPIKDGTTGNLAKVDSTFRLSTRSVISNEEKEANESGNAYNINTGTINLSDAVETPVIYLRNGELLDLHITSIAVGMSPSTGGSGGVPVVTIIRNPSAGTIISSPTDVDINSNRNYSSSKSLSGTLAYKGATGDTMTDGSDHLLFYQKADTRAFLGVDELLPTGSSIGIKITPQSGNTSMDVYCAIICHLEVDF